MKLLTNILIKNPFLLYLVVVMLGIATGLSEIHFLQTLGKVLADCFISIFKCISTPILALSLIVTLAGYENSGSMKNLWRKTIFYTIATTLIAATVSCFLYLIIDPSNVQDLGQTTTSSLPNDGSYIQHLVTLIPTNLLSPFMEHQVIGVLLIALAIGIAIQSIPDTEAKKVVTHFFKGLYGCFFVITKWVVAILPLGLFGFITVTVMQFRQGLNISSLGAYLSIIVLANLIQGLVILPLWLSLNRINPLKAMLNMLPALSVAFFSKSSTGTLPVTIETAEKRLHIHPKISRFILPLCTSINMNGCAAFIFATVIYLMQNQGMDVSYSTMATWIVIATIAAIGNAGVPMGCFFLSASLLSTMNIPITLLGIILPFYTLIDMLETSLNVWSDSCVANVINQQEKKVDSLDKDKLTVAA